jgi:hypothetical protein
MLGWPISRHGSHVIQDPCSVGYEMPTSILRRSYIGHDPSTSDNQKVSDSPFIQRRKIGEFQDSNGTPPTESWGFGEGPSSCMTSHGVASSWAAMQSSMLASPQGAHVQYVRRKPARMDAESTRSKSCSDKLALRQVSSLLSCNTSRLVASSGNEPGMAGIDTLVCFQTLPPLANIAHAKPAFGHSRQRFCKAEICALSCDFFRRRRRPFGVWCKI